MAAREDRSVISDSCSSSCTRRRVASYSRAFSIAPATSEAEWITKLASSSVSVRGACECRPMTPNTAPSFAISGTDTIDWYFSSSNSGKYRARGSASASDGMKIGWRCSLTQPAKPSPGASVARPTASAYCDDAARSTSRPPRSTIQTKHDCAFTPSTISRTTASSTCSRSTVDDTVRMISYRIRRSSAGASGSTASSGDVSYIAITAVCIRDRVAWSPCRPPMPTRPLGWSRPATPPPSTPRCAACAPAATRWTPRSWRPPC